MKLLLKVSAIIIAVMFLACAVIYYITWSSMVNTVAAQSKERLEELAITTMDKIDRTLFERGGDLEAIASDPIIRSRDSSPQQITERLIEYRDIYKTYASLSFFDLNRVRIADTTGLSLGKQDSKFRGWDEVLQGKLSLGSDIGFSHTLNLPVIFFASPVRDKNNELFGVVIIRVPVDKLYDIVGTLSLEPHIEKHERIDLIDKDGLVIYSNYNRNGMLREKLPYWETVKNKRGSAGFLKAHRHPGQEESVAVFCCEQGYLGFKGNEWTLIIHIPTSVVFAPVVALRNKWLLVIFAGTILAIIIALIMSMRLSKPLTSLRDAVAEVGRGDLDARITINSRDEIGELGDAFNQMVKNLKNTTTSIDSLEREIALRRKSESQIRKLNRLQMDLLVPEILEQQLKKITDGVVEIFNADFCRIWLIAQGDRCTAGCPHAGVTEGPHVCRYRDKCLHLVASSGRYTHLDGETHRRVPFGCYKIGGIASGEYPSFLTNDVVNDPRVHNHEWAKQLGLVSFTGVQLRPPHGEAIGVLALFSQSVISDEEYSLLEGVGNLALRVMQTAQAREAVRESEEKYRALVETTGTGYVILDLTGKVVDANDEYARLTGHEHRDEILGRSLLEWTAAYDRERNAKAVEDCAREGFLRNLVIDYVGPQGQIIPIEGNGTLVATKSGTQLLALCRDITERTRTEEERERLIAELRASLAEVKTLSGLLPICASCKKIRDDQGYWNRIESYITDHSEAEFSHGICPECAEKLYPELSRKMYAESDQEE